jgi:hypothetical protein
MRPELYNRRHVLNTIEQRKILIYKLQQENYSLSKHTDALREQMPH